MNNLRRGRAALLVAHPGHELRLHGWLEAARPVVATMTDGSGSAGASRLGATGRVLRAAGCALAPFSGRFTDRDVYRSIIEGDVDAIASLTLELAQSLSVVEYLVADAWEFYNPVHDLARVVADLAVRHAELRTERTIGNYAFAVVGDPTAGGTDDIVVTLDDEALRRKLDSANGYTEMRGEIEQALRANGVDAFRTERLRPVAADGGFPEPIGRPYYEQRGEEQVAAGHYRTVLRYREHFIPFVRALSETVARASAVEPASVL